MLREEHTPDASLIRTQQLKKKAGSTASFHLLLSLHQIPELSLLSSILIRQPHHHLPIGSNYHIMPWIIAHHSRSFRTRQVA